MTSSLQSGQIAVNDVVLAIDGADISMMSLDEATARTIGPEGQSGAFPTHSPALRCE